ncbi:hypothetical protein H8B15_08105 [Hymenobacter sp. BT507]|uniref:Uncharacterized protein n=1 Tax=Hymenobacter citatus TaxID=2763506 RepID=A0ABR7MII5_9BACT|nr:hypothetical protein [Hymenobacter citatus]MBC6610883.1 hypothetical protein [Hymenobacter citatus]
MPLTRSTLFTCLLLGGLATACSPDQQKKPAATSASQTPPIPDSLTIRQAAQTYRVQYAAPVPLDSGRYVYQPIMAVKTGRQERPLIDIKGDAPTSYASTNYDSARGPVFNLLFYHLPTGRTHLLLDNGGYRIEKVITTSYPHLFYQMITADRNGDGELTSADGRILFISNRAGEQLHQLTPDSTRLESWQLIPNTKMLLAELRYDSDRNGQFDDTDKTYWLRYPLNAQQPPTTPVFVPDSLAQVVRQQMLYRQSRLRGK